MYKVKVGNILILHRIKICSNRERSTRNQLSNSHNTILIRIKFKKTTKLKLNLRIHLTRMIIKIKETREHVVYMQTILPMSFKMATFLIRKRGMSHKIIVIIEDQTGVLVCKLFLHALERKLLFITINRSQGKKLSSIKSKERA